MYEREKIILKHMSLGIDPSSEEEKERVVALAIKALDRMARAETKIKNLPENHGRPWSEEDEEYLIEHFDKTRDTEEMVEELAQKLGRTNHSIRMKLKHFEEFYHYIF